MAEKCIRSLTNHHSQFSRKEVGKHVKNVILKETQKTLKKPFAVHNSIFYFSKRMLILDLKISEFWSWIVRKNKRIDNIREMGF